MKRLTYTKIINSGSKEGRNMTEEQKEAARIRLANARKKMGKK